MVAGSTFDDLEPYQLWVLSSEASDELVENGECIDRCVGRGSVGEGEHA